MITTLLNADHAEWAREYEKQEREVRFAMKYPRLANIVGGIRVAWYTAVEATLCKWFGHRIEMDGWATPDSGGEEWWCVRCLSGGHHIYY